jgi:CRP-like cAMP-binding protein
VDSDPVLSRLFGKYCPEGTVLYAEGSAGEDLFLVQGGAVRLVRARSGGAPVAEARGPGQIFGEEGFFGRAPRTARAEAIADTQLLRLSDRTLDAVARHGPEVARTVAEGLLEAAGTAARRLEAWVLSRQALRAEPHLRGGGECTPEELAGRSGLSPGAARAVLEALAARGALVRDAGGYRVAEPEALGRAILALGAAAD